MMLREYFDQYAKAHQHPANRLCHSIGIPCIMASLIWLVVAGVHAPGPWLLFAVGWIFQFIGHAVEKTMPEFMKNPIFLVIGPLYFLDKLLNKKRVS